MPKAAVLTPVLSTIDPDAATLTLDDVCLQLNLKRRTVRYLMDAGFLKFLRTGRPRRPTYRFRQSWVDDYVDRAGRARGR